MAVTVPVTDALFTNLVAVVQGTKTAEEAFASFLQSVAKMLMDVATQMIATYMAIGLARAFAGMGNDGGSHRLEGVPASPAVKAGYPGNLNYAEGGLFPVLLALLLAKAESLSTSFLKARCVKAWRVTRVVLADLLLSRDRSIWNVR